MPDIQKYFAQNYPLPELIPAQLFSIADSSFAFAFGFFFLRQILSFLTNAQSLGL